MENVDVIIIGAGMAGLTAARHLKESGAKVLVLEAQNRVGGRLLSEETKHNDKIDLGGQWIGPTQTMVEDLAKELGIVTFPQFNTGKKILHFEGKKKTYKDTIPALPFLSLLDLQNAIKKIDNLAKKIPLENPADGPMAEELDSMTVESWLQKQLQTGSTKKLFNILTKAVFAAEPADLSMLFFLFYVHSGGGLMKLAEINDGAQQTRFEGGAQQLATGLANHLQDELVLEQVVRAIHQHEGGVIVETADDAFTAKFAIVAIPPALACRIQYFPALPGNKDQLMQKMPMGSVIKCVVTYKKPFWREDGLSGEFLSDSGPISLGFDDSPKDANYGAIIGFISGNMARKWTTALKQDRREAVSDQLVAIFGSKAAEFTHYHEKDWQAEPYTRGCYVGYMPPNVLSLYGKTLREPCGKIHWAGTETSEIWNGYIEGAIRSGVRVANEIKALLGKQSPEIAPPESEESAED
jgi:monoamine oxidase